MSTPLVAQNVDPLGHNILKAIRARPSGAVATFPFHVFGGAVFRSFVSFSPKNVHACGCSLVPCPFRFFLGSFAIYTLTRVCASPSFAFFVARSLVLRCFAAGLLLFLPPFAGFFSSSFASSAWRLPP